MKKAIVIGCPGSGKSTFARALSKYTNIPVYHLDMMYWNSDKTVVEKSVFLNRLEEVLAREYWIIDGNYGSTMERRMSVCDTVFFLDYPLEVCLDGIEKRRGKSRPDMPWIETEPDGEFIDFIKNYNLQSRPKVEALLEKYGNKDVFVFTSRAEADEFIKKINPDK